MSLEVLLFSSSAKTDTGSKSFDCALVLTMETYDDPENEYYMYYMYYMNYMYYMYFNWPSPPKENPASAHTARAPPPPLPWGGGHVLYVLCILTWNLLFCFGRMAEVDWIPDFIRAWPQKARTLCHPCRSYPGKTSSVGDTGTIPHHLRNMFQGAPGNRRPDAGDGCRMWFVTHGNGVVP